MNKLHKDRLVDLNILIVEDNLDDLTFLEHHLHRIKHRNIKVESCSSLASGLAVISKGWADIVFLDLSLPDSYGIETVKKVQLVDSSLPIVVLTGTDDEDLAFEAINLGAQDYIVKGELNFSLLGRSITYAIERQRNASTTVRLNLAVKTAGLGQWSCDLHDNTISWDAGMYVLFGLDEKHFAPTLKQFLKCIHTNDRAFVMKTLRKKEAFDFDCRVIWPDGSLRNITLKGDVLRDSIGDPRQIAGVCFDISDRKSAERALQASEHRLRLALESAKMGVWDWDLSGLTVSRSPLHDYIYGYDTVIPEWSYPIFLTHVLPEDVDFVKRTVDQGLVEGHFDMECRIIHAGNQSVHWVSIRGEAGALENGKPTRIIGTIKDITESKMLEQLALEAQEKREQTLHAIVQHAPIGVVILDSELNVIDTNAAFNSMIGQNQLELTTRPLMSILPYEEIQTAQLRTKQGTPVQIAKLEVSLQPGRKNYWDLSLWPILRGGGITSGAVLQVVDCTHTVLLERQRDDFVASIAHDIKNPLVGASRILDTMCNQSVTTSKENQVTFLNALRESNQNLLSLVQNLVDICRYETLAYPCLPERIVASELFESCIQQLAHFAALNNVSLYQSVANHSDYFMADSIGIRRVLMNLLHNAIKFNKDGGEVTVSFEHDESSVRICVADTGDGMSEPDQQLLFQRFSQGIQGRRFASGTGLGLYLSKQIIEAHHGKITCTSETGKGSSFVITLPQEKA